MMKEQKRRILWMIVSIVLPGQLIVSSAMGDLITITDAEQQVGSQIGYSIGDDDFIALEDYDPDVPQGIGNANLNVSLLEPDFTASGAAALLSVFAADYVSANGSAGVSATWSTPPAGADDIHLGAGSSFLMTFTTGDSPVFFDIDGIIEVGLVNYLDLRPDETFAYMRLSSTSGPVLWEERLDGLDTPNSISISHTELLASNQEYLFEAYAESGTMADLAHQGFKSRNASFSFSNTVTAVPAPGAILLGCIGLSMAGWKLRKRGDL